MFEHSPVSITDFRGRFERGEAEATPLGFFSDEGNLTFSREGVETRRGFSPIAGFSTSTVILRAHEFRRIGEASRFIYLTDTGDFYDSLYPSTPILSLGSGVEDFALAVVFNRAYISPHDRSAGLTGRFVYVYDGSGSARKAAGSAPSAFTLVVAEGSASGNDAIEKGIHLFAVAYETASGFITKPGTGTVVAVLDATGGKVADLSGIPVGPSGTVARHILTTKIIPNYAAGTEAYQEWFFLPDGRIGDNVTTTKNGISFYDITLQDSADYLLTQLEEIPAGVFLVDYEGQLCVGGEAQNNSTVRVSSPGNPESFSALDGFVNVNPGDGGGVTNGVSHRGSLYISKSQRFYATNKSAGSPSSWPVISVDSGIGTECFGISSVLDSRGHSRDQFLVAARSGLYQYLGAFAERELTWNVRDLWARINKIHFSKVQVMVDPQREWIVVALPLDAATANSHLLVGDYSEALDPTGVKWSLWTLPKAPTSSLIQVDYSSKVSMIVYGSVAGGLYYYDDSSRNDYGTRIDGYLETNLIELQGNVDGINHYAGVRMRVRGDSTLTVRLSGYDKLQTESYPSITLSATPGEAKLVRTDFLAERVSVKLTQTTYESWFLLNRLTVHVKPLWAERAE
jgi:hypothetical protein